MVWNTGPVGFDWPEMARKYRFRWPVLAGLQNEGHWSAGDQEKGPEHLGAEKKGGTLKWNRVTSYVHVLYVFSKGKRVRS